MLRRRTQLRMRQRLSRYKRHCESVECAKRIANESDAISFERVTSAPSWSLARAPKNTAHHLSFGTFSGTWTSAEQYCFDICYSYLPSIHCEAEYQESFGVEADSFWLAGIGINERWYICVDGRLSLRFREHGVSHGNLFVRVALFVGIIIGLGRVNRDEYT